MELLFTCEVSSCSQMSVDVHAHVLSVPRHNHVMPQTVIGLRSVDKLFVKQHNSLFLILSSVIYSTLKLTIVFIGGGFG